MSGVPIGELLGAGVCLALGSMVAGVESAVVSLSEPRLRALHDEVGARRKVQIGRYLANPPAVLTRLLAARVTFVIVGSVLATNALARGREALWKLAAIVLGLTLIYGLFAELFMTLGRARARTLAPAGLALTQPLEWLIAPVAAPLAMFGRAIYARITARASGESPPLTEREVEYVVEEAEHSGALDPKRGEIMQNALELKDLTARDVMVPRTRMHAIEATTTPERALAIVIEEGHSRVPVYRGQIDNVVGVLHVKDLFRVTRGLPVAPHATSAVRPSERPGRTSERPTRVTERPPANTVEAVARKPAFFVAESQSALAVLREMQARRTHMAIVVDEFGAVAGLVTLEDVLEELVGDIQDEHDVDEAPIVDLGNGTLLASAAIPVSELGEHLGVELPEAETYASLGGFLAERAGKVPAVGTVVHWNGFRFTVREGDARRATKVEIVRERAAAGARPPAAAAAE